MHLVTSVWLVKDACEFDMCCMSTCSMLLERWFKVGWDRHELRDFLGWEGEWNKKTCCCSSRGTSKQATNQKQPRLPFPTNQADRPDRQPANGHSSFSTLWNHTHAKVHARLGCHVVQFTDWPTTLIQATVSLYASWLQTHARCAPCTLVVDVSVGQTLPSRPSNFRWIIEILWNFMKFLNLQKDSWNQEHAIDSTAGTRNNMYASAWFWNGYNRL